MLNASKTLSGLLALGLLASLLSVSACGRAGAPQKPSGAVVADDGSQAEPQVEDKPFVLDGLLN